MNPLDIYLAAVELALIESAIITEYKTLRAWVKTEAGYIRFRANLTNGDFLEAAEHFILARGQIETNDYHYQWMNGAKTTLYRRWDNTPHYPDLDNFPHHIHLGQNGPVVSGKALNVVELLTVLSDLLSAE